MNRKIEILFLTFIIFLFITVLFFLPLTYASTIPSIVNYKLNGKEESAKLNPSIDGSKVSIEINANVPVKFNTIALCIVTDDVCNRDTAVKYFYQIDDFSSFVIKPWDGKPSDGKVKKGVIVSDGDHYKIKVTMVDKDGVENSQKDLSPHIITIDSNFSGGSSESSSSASQNFSSQTSSVSSDTPSSGSSSFISTHSSPEDLSSSSKSSSRFEVISGRDRLAYSGTPVIFSGEAIIPKSLEGQGVRFVWSFGDGSVAEGKKVSHNYKFSGDYVVVLNASLSDLSAVSRTGVKVVNPSVVISNISGDSVEIWNRGIFEINLNGWLISNNHGKFIFPLDTIIGPNKKITVPDEYMKLNLAQVGKVSLLNPSQKEISAFAYGGEGSSSSPTLAVNSSNLDNDPVVIKIREFIAKGGKAPSGNRSSTFDISKNNLIAQVGEAPVSPHEKSIAENKKVAVSENSEIISSSTQTAAIVSSAPSARGFVRTVLNLPSSGFSFIKKAFYSGN